MKKCTSCKEELKLSNFRKNGKYLASVCNKCAVENYRERHLLKTYGLTPNEYDEMLSSQNNKCKICNNLEKPNRRLCVDHCHTTNNIRGLLCDNCNTALGKFQDNVEILKKAIDYLENFKK